MASTSSTERLKQKKNMILFQSSQKNKYDKKQRDGYENVLALNNGELVFHEEKPESPWCNSTSPELFIFKFIPNDSSIPIESWLNYLPIININNSFSFEVDVSKLSHYLIVRVRCTILRDDSPIDGISFYETVTKYNEETTSLQIVQFGNIPLSRQGFQFKNK